MGIVERADQQSKSRGLKSTLQRITKPTLSQNEQSLVFQSFCQRFKPYLPFLPLSKLSSLSFFNFLPDTSSSPFFCFIIIIIIFKRNGLCPLRGVQATTWVDPTHKEMNPMGDATSLGWRGVSHRLFVQHFWQRR